VYQGHVRLEVIDCVRRRPRPLRDLRDQELLKYKKGPRDRSHEIGGFEPLEPFLPGDANSFDFEPLTLHAVGMARVDERSHSMTSRAQLGCHGCKRSNIAPGAIRRQQNPHWPMIVD
jgi:hypothetical protein